MESKKKINQYKDFFLREVESATIRLSANKQAQAMYESGGAEYQRGFADGLKLLEDRNEALNQLYSWRNVRQE